MTIEKEAEFTVVQGDGLLTDEQIEKIRAAGHAEFYAIRCKSGIAVVRKCSRDEYKRFVAQSATDKVVAMENLCKSACIVPGAAALDKWFSDYTGQSGVIANKILDLAGFDESPEAKKY